MQERRIAEVCAACEELPCVQAVRLVGSRAEGGGDRYSDVDLLLETAEPPDQVICSAAALVQERFRPVWLDGAKSLLPKKFLFSAFLGGENPFAFFDIGVLGDGRCTVARELFCSDRWTHLLKLWVMNYKYYRRGAPFFIASYGRMMGKAGLSASLPPAEGFTALLRLLQKECAVSPAYLSLLWRELETDGS